MIENAAAVQVPPELLDLIDGNRVSDADVDATAFLERAASVDTDQPPVAVEQRSTRITGVDGGIRLDAVGIFQDRPGWVLVAVNARYHSEADGRLQVRGQQEGIADGETPIPDADAVAVTQFGHGEVVPAEQLDQGHIAGRIDRNGHRVIETPVGQAAFQVIPDRRDHVEVGQRISVRESRQRPNHLLYRRGRIPRRRLESPWRWPPFWSVRLGAPRPERRWRPAQSAAAPSAIRATLMLRNTVLLTLRVR